MQNRLLAKNLRGSPLIPNHYAVQVLAAIGGHVILGDPTSKQGGTNVQDLLWENYLPINDKNEILAINNLIAFCRRKKIFYVISPSMDEKTIMVYCALDGHNKACTGKTLEGTFAAALVLLLEKENGNSENENSAD